MVNSMRRWSTPATAGSLYPALLRGASLVNVAKYASDLPGQELWSHDHRRALQRAFEDVGVEFLPDDDVRVRAPTSPDK
jgi:hypothetical protein